ncbi:MAG: aminotransferase class I/II-fold pyridoxal phosphate-dependent enzyme [Candidatus Bathyarchaeota archaeon]
MSEKIEKYRQDISEIDSQILRLASTRLQIAEKIGAIKRQRNLPVTNLRVEAEVISRSVKLAKEIGLDEAFTVKLVNMLIVEAVNVQGGALKNRAPFLYEIFEKVKALQADGEKVIRLDAEELDLSSPADLTDALKDAHSNSFDGYASAKGLTELRQAIAEDLNQTYGANIDAEQVLITQGEKFAIFSAVLSMISPGNHVAIAEPAWPFYGSCASLANGRADTIHTRFEDSWEFDMTEVEETFTIKPKLFILCSPSNPTGKVISQKQLRDIAQLAEKNGTYMLADEVYCAYSAVPFNSILQIMDSNFIYINSLSKRYGMPGWRIGYLVSDVKTITRIQNLIQISVTYVPEFIQRAALKALKMRPDSFNAFAESMKRRINIACRELDKLPVSYIKPEGGMYVFPKAKLENFNSNDFANKLLEKEKIAIAPGEAFGDYPKHFRISLGADEMSIKNGITRMGKAISRWQEM